MSENYQYFLCDQSDGYFDVILINYACTVTKKSIGKDLSTFRSESGISLLFFYVMRMYVIYEIFTENN